MVCSALDFLSAICVRSQYKDMFKADGVLKTLAGQFAIQITVVVKGGTVGTRSVCDWWRMITVVLDLIGPVCDSDYCSFGLP